MAQSAWGRPLSLYWRDLDGSILSTEFAEARALGNEVIIRIRILPDLLFAFEDIDDVSTSIWLRDAGGAPLVHTTPTGTDSWDVEIRPSVFGLTQLTSQGPIGISHSCPPGPNPPPPGCWHQTYTIEFALTALVDNAPPIYFESGETLVVNQLGQPGPDSEAAGLRLPFVVNPPVSGLRFDESLSVTGVTDLGSLAPHPAGDALYVTGGNSATLTAVSLDPVTGTPTVLSQRSLASDGLPLGGAGPVAVTPDGFVIVGSASALVIFETDPLSGDLGLASAVPVSEPVTSLALSTDGTYLYVASSASPAQGRIESYERSGLELFLRQDLDIPELAGVRHLALSSDGTHLYAASTAGVLSLFQIGNEPPLTLAHGRDPGIGIGSLDFVLPIPDPDGSLLYAASESSDALGLIRSSPTQAATLLWTASDGAGPISGLADPGALALDALGTRLYVHASGQQNLVVFVRNPQDASLHFVEAVPAAAPPAAAAALTTLLVSDPHLYVLNYEDGALHRYSIDRDRDDIADPLDNCPNTSNPLQIDRGGAVVDPGQPSAPPDGWGDACQCADLDDDGSFALADIGLLRQKLVDGGQLSAGAQRRCPSGACDLLSVVLMQRSLQGLAPGIPLACGSSDPRDADADLFSTVLDCDDSNPEVHPGSVEVCDDIDRDCNGGRRAIGASGCTTLFPDRDGDGYASDSSFPFSQCLCTDAPTGVFSTLVFGDCDDLVAEISPAAPEVECDGLDNDCDPSTLDAPLQTTPVVTGSFMEGTLVEAACFDDRITKAGYDPWEDSTSDGCSGGPNVIGLPLGFQYVFGEGAGGMEVGGVDLPCNNHDRCYWTCGLPQAYCDNEFYLDMLDVCAADGNILDQAYCADVALVYALAGMSQQGYLNGQQNACRCGLTVCE